MSHIQRVVILGGGSAGLLTALTLKARLPTLSVQIVRSPAISIIGVGEGSTADLPAHLHGFCNLDPARFHAEAKPTWKLGVRFLWGPRDRFDYTFTYQVTGGVPGLRKPRGFYCSDDFRDADLNASLMAAGRVFPRQANGAPDIQKSAAYHIENADLVSYLERASLECGVQISEGTVSRVHLVENGEIGRVELANGGSVSGDLYVDASGFRSELLGKALGEPFLDYTDSLFCDRAVIGGWERGDEPILPYTTAETMDAGWAWQIEHERHINRGYVYSSAFISDSDAETEFLRKNPKIQKTRVVPFRPGRYRNSWIGNCVAVGNASGFVEPLEATALMVICHQARFICQVLGETDLQPGTTVRASYNRMVNRIWDEIRDFLAVHYRFNTRLETDFWRHCRADAELHGAAPIVEFYRENGPNLIAQLDLLPADRSLFQLEGFYTILLGQRVPFRQTFEPTAAELATWERHRQENRSRANTGLTVRESLDYVRHPYWRWTPGFYTNSAA